MRITILRQLPLAVFSLLSACSIISAQSNFNLKFSNSTIYTGIEVGSKGVKMSMVEIGGNAQSRGAFNILKDTTINTDFISFSPATFEATLNGLCHLYQLAGRKYKIPSKNVFTVISSGVKIQAQKESKTEWIKTLIDSFRLRVNEPERIVEVVDVIDEARLSHLGIIPESKRFSTFLIDIGSGNTKGGYFPYDNTKHFKLFELTWGTKSTANAAEKLCGDDNSLLHFNRMLSRVLAGAENSEIIYAVNASGAYALNDHIAISGGIAWALATLMHPELIDHSVVSVTYEEVYDFQKKILDNHASLSGEALARTVKDGAVDKSEVIKTANTVNKVFDQKSLLAGTGLLLKMMRQFKSIYETKEFFLVKNGQVGWVSAYVDQSINN